MSGRSVVARSFGLLAVAILSACAIGQAGSASPGRMLQDAMAALVSARSVTLDGTVSIRNVSYRVTLQEDANGGAGGSVTVDQRPVVVRWTSGRLFLMSRPYFDAQKLPVHDRWALAQRDDLLPLVRSLASRKELADSLLKLAGANVEQRSGPNTGGASTTQLFSDAATVTVPASGGVPIRLATELDQPLADGLSDLKLAVSASNTENPIAAPSPFVDLADANTMPADFDDVTQPSDTFRFESCDAAGCRLAEDFRNGGGRQGTATATFVVEHGADRIGWCVVPIPTTGHGETVRAGCRVTWDQSLDVSASVEIANPD